MDILCIFQDSTVTITIGSVSINEDASIMGRSDIQMLFVEYRFLNVPLEETETPFSLPKPKPGNRITFNFRKGNFFSLTFTST